MRTYERLYDKILACWMGKNIGGTMGGPVEGRMEILHFTGLPDIGADGPLPNDDLDLQLVNLHTLEQHGAGIVTGHLSEEWAEHVRFPFDEYGYALMNIRKNIAAPLSGGYNNPFVDCMGCPIRSELWSAIAPGNPERAVYFACQDAMVDHAGGEGMYGEIFFAALESLAFENGDKEQLIEKALAFLPEDSRVYCAVRDTLEWYRQGVSYEYIRGMILGAYGSRNFTDAPQNIAFTMVGLLYGEDFADGMLKTINLGYDTDCTCATFGSIYGILYGTAGIPKDWADSVGENIKISREICGIDYPRTLSELTDRTLLIKQRLECENRIYSVEKPDKNYNSQHFYLPDVSGDLKISISAKKSAATIPGRDQPVSVNFCNTGCDTWNFTATISGCKPKDKQTTSVLAPGEAVTLEYLLNGMPDRLMTIPYCLSIEREHDGELWKSYQVNFVLPSASKWLIDGEETYLEGGFVTFSAGEHHMQTTLDVPTDRTVKLICASPDKLSLALDGEMVIESNGSGSYMPAFHRCPEDQFVNLSLTAGRHDIIINTESNGDSKLMLLPVSINNKGSKGCNYYFIDCAIGSLK